MHMQIKKGRIKKIELLAPAGSPEKLKYAIHYGADAVYAGIPDFSMRYRINKFDEKSLAEAVKFVHERKKKIYVTVNIYPHNKHLPRIEKHLKFLKRIRPDGIIISDPGIIMLAKKYLPEIDIHLSTQANAINWQAVKFWHELGVKRVVLAREVSLDEVKEIKKKAPAVELEYFIHGAMCMSYSGRCILSKWMAGRSANLGDCAQPCRWSYGQKSQALNPNFQTNSKFNPPVGGQNYRIFSMGVEDARGEYEIDLEEDQNGTYFFNSKDLNLLNYLDDLQKAGVDSFKIEGRNKSVYYLATVVRAYKKVISSLGSPTSKLNKITQEQWEDLNDLMHRGYTTGFLFGEPEHNYKTSHTKSSYEFVGEVLGSEGDILKIKAHNAFYETDKIEIIGKDKNIQVKIKKILDEDKKEVVSAHGGHEKTYYLEIDKKNIQPLSLIRKKIILRGQKLENKGN